MLEMRKVASSNIVLYSFVSTDMGIFAVLKFGGAKAIDVNVPCTLWLRIVLLIARRTNLMTAKVIGIERRYYTYAGLLATFRRALRYSKVQLHVCQTRSCLCEGSLHCHLSRS